MPTAVNRTDLHDLLRGIAQLTGDPILRDLAALVAQDVPDELSIAFNHKQIASKQWLVQTLLRVLPGDLGEVWILGAWYGVLGALLLNEPRFRCRRITSVDLDAGACAIAERLNRRHVATGRFRALATDMLDLNFARDGEERPGLIVNTSCEHLADVPGWIATLPAGVPLVLQSNDYVREPDHLSCVPDLAAFERQANLGRTEFAGQLPSKNYTRFMLVGAR